MKFTRGDTILHELGHHLPFTLAASLLAGVLVAIVYNFWVIPSESFFEVLHPAHVLVSAAATSAIYYKYKPGFARSVYRGIGVSGYRKIGEAVLVGVVGAILIGSLSDVLLPWVGGNLLGLETILHLPILESSFLILGMAIIGSLFGIYIGLFKINHTLHVFLSVFASLFYLLAFSISMNVWVVLAISLVVFLVVYIPCCISDIVFPLLFIKKPCRKCGHWHD